jgi:4-diphosphocytidyl-2-C-methyl-D-erythritol kinase
MTRSLRLIAPAKINWTLEVLRFRPDGYHEIRSVLQTIDLHDSVTLTDADAVTLELTGDSGPLGDAPPESNLAVRAARALNRRLGNGRGAHIAIEKGVPVAAGLGGGSSDAAAVLRGLNILWDARQDDANLMEIAAEIGSDPPFFIVGGTAVAVGRGEQVEPLTDALAPGILLATPPAGERGEKTASMFAALEAGHFSDGYVTIGLREIVRAGRMIVDADLNNIFERVTAAMQPQTELAMNALRSEGYVPHLAGSGPAFFVLFPGGADLAQELSARIAGLGFEPRVCHALRRERALAIEER